MDKGVRNARRKATDNDKIGRKFRAEASEKQAAKARQTQRLIDGSRWLTSLARNGSCGCPSRPRPVRAPWWRLCVVRPSSGVGSGSVRWM
jgi:hypothetical protein